MATGMLIKVLEPKKVVQKDFLGDIKHVLNSAEA